MNDYVDGVMRALKRYSVGRLNGELSKTEDHADIREEDVQMAFKYLLRQSRRRWLGSLPDERKLLLNVLGLPDDSRHIQESNGDDELALCPDGQLRGSKRPDIVISPPDHPHDTIFVEIKVGWRNRGRYAHSYGGVTNHESSEDLRDDLRRAIKKQMKKQVLWAAKCTMRDARVHLIRGIGIKSQRISNQLISFEWQRGGYMDIESPTSDSSDSDTDSDASSDSDADSDDSSSSSSPSSSASSTSTSEEDNNSDSELAEATGRVHI